MGFARGSHNTCLARSTKAEKIYFGIISSLLADNEICFFFSLFVPHTSLLLHTLQRWRKFFFNVLENASEEIESFPSFSSSPLLIRITCCMAKEISVWKQQNSFSTNFEYHHTNNVAIFPEWTFHINKIFWCNCVFFSSVCHNELFDCLSLGLKRELVATIESFAIFVELMTRIQH